MGLREDMTERCKKSKADKEEPCGGSVEITAQHRQDSNNDVQDMLMRASQGCRSGCRCMKVEARIDVVDGKEVVVTRCNPDPKLTPFTAPHES